MKRRDFLSVSAALTAGAFVTPADAFASRPLRVLVATNEPWGTYHVKPLLDEAAAAHPAGRWTLTQVVPDRAGVKPDDPVPVVTLDEAHRHGADVLVVNGASEWPTTVVRQLTGLPVVASSTAYLTPEEAPGARVIRPRVRALTAGSVKEADVFAVHLGVPPSRVHVVGNPALDDLPPYAPQPRHVVIATSVSRSSKTGGSAPGAEVLRETAAALQADGYRVRVGLHPREDASLWSAFEIATEGTLRAAATAQVTVGIPGSIFPQIAAVGCPLVGVVADGLATPDYLLDLCASARTVAAARTAVADGWRPDDAVLRAAIGPVGGAGARVWKQWRKAAHPVGRSHTHR